MPYSEKILQMQAIKIFFLNFFEYTFVERFLFTFLLPLKDSLQNLEDCKLSK